MDKMFFILAGVVTIGMLALMAWSVSGALEHERRLMAECMADGKKEYECYAMMKQDTVPVAIPVVIPSNG